MDDVEDRPSSDSQAGSRIERRSNHGDTCRDDTYDVAVADHRHANRFGVTLRRNCDRFVLDTGQEASMSHTFQ